MANCGCPTGSVLVTLPNGVSVCRHDTMALAEGPLPQIGCQKVAQGITATPQGPGIFGRSKDYCKLGAFFYPETALLSYPIKFVSGCLPGTQGYQDFTSAPIVPIANTSNSLWGTGAPTFDGRFNVVGITLDPNIPCASVGTTGFYGHVFCLTITSPTTYCFGFGGQKTQIIINGGVFVNTTNQDIYQYEAWHVIQLTLQPGTHIIQMNGAFGGITSCGPWTFPTSVPGTDPGWAFEIYQATAAALSVMTSPAQLTPVTIFSTVNEFGQPIDYGEAIWNYRCSCSNTSPLPCPTPFGQFNVVVPALDNCTVNALNPSGSPSIYVCHTYDYTQATSCCFQLIDCENPANVIVTSTDLTVYIGQVITIQEAAGCFVVGPAQDCTGSEVPVTIISNHVDCVSCVPKCFALTDCKGIQPAIITNTNLASQLGNVITIEGSNTCWIVSNATSCVGAIAVAVVYTYTGTNPCYQCSPTCYLLTDCENPSNTIVTSTDLSAVVGQVIQLTGCGPKACWSVGVSPTCTGAIAVSVDTTFATCAECLPIVVPDPIIIHNRKVRPGYKVNGSCSPAYVDKVECGYAEEIFKVVKKRRYGISNCCGDDLVKYQIKKALLDLNMIYDPTACIPSPCCAPTCLTVEFKVYNPFVCPDPTGVEAVLLYPITCPPPNDIGPVQIVFNNPSS